MKALARFVIKNRSTSSSVIVKPSKSVLFNLVVKSYLINIVGIA